MCLMDDFGHLFLPLKDIRAATNNFTDKPIGGGGFGKVYKGVLHLQNGRRMVAAFKRLDPRYGQGEVEFWNEILMLSDLKHKNLARLLHFCNEDNERIIVYKYMSRGSLDKYLGDSSLTWPQRLFICHGAGKAIAYLHDSKESQQRVVHRDLKSSNILLSDKWTPKVSDFGLSKICPANQPRSYLVTNIVGTPGYCDPAYFETGVLSKECDVYSFGVVLFEVMCGRLCCVYDKDKLRSILVKWWKDSYDENRLYDIIFPALKEEKNQKALFIFSAIASRCLNSDHKKRPTMVEIVNELEAAIHHQQQVSFDIGRELEAPVHHQQQVSSEIGRELEAPIHHQQVSFKIVKELEAPIHHQPVGFEIVKELEAPIHHQLVSFKIVKELEAPIHHQPVGFEIVKELEAPIHHQLVSFENGKELKAPIHHQQNNADQHHAIVPMIPVSYQIPEEFPHFEIISTDITLATDNFSDNYIIGRGGFGKVREHGSLDLHLGDASLTWIQCWSKVFSVDNEQPDLISDIGGTPGYRFGCLLYLLLLGYISGGNLCIDYDEGKRIKTLVPGWRKYYEDKRLGDLPLLQVA